MKSYPIFVPQLLILIVSLSLLSCGNELSRNQAQSLISKKLNLPQSENGQFDVTYVEGKVPWNLTHISKEEEAMLTEFSQRKLISLKRIPHTTDLKRPFGGVMYTNKWTTIKVELTDEGRKYLVKGDKEKYIVKINDIVFGEVTGIQTHKELNMAEVEFTLKRVNPTPFNNASKQQFITQKASFSLFDDGWRVE